MDAQILVWLLVVIGVELGVLVWRTFLPAYVRKKGENLATKQDIAGITNQVESVKSFYTNALEDLRSRQQLRMVAVEKRLEAHQQAYTLWRKLWSSEHSNDIISVVLECQEWWKHNCLYLAPPAREAFVQAYFAAKDHRDLLARGSGASGADIRENSQIIMKAGEAIVSGVELPPLGEREAEDVMDKTRPSQSDAR
jgi:hypothetical protein